MVNDDAKLQAALSPANAGVHEVKDYVNELELPKAFIVIWKYNRSRMDHWSLEPYWPAWPGFSQWHTGYL